MSSCSLKSITLHSSRCHRQHNSVATWRSLSPWGGGALPSLHSAGHAAELEALAAGDGRCDHLRRPVLHESPGADVLANVLDAEDHRGDVAVLGKLTDCAFEQATTERRTKAGENLQVKGPSRKHGLQARQQNNQGVSSDEGRNIPEKLTRSKA